MILVDCSEISSDEKLALASMLSDRLEGIAVALIRGDDIVLDALSSERLDQIVVNGVVTDFVSRRKDASHNRVEVSGSRIIVRSRDSVSAKRRKKQSQLPPNLKQCPFCGFVTQHEDLMMLHVRLHGGSA